MIASIIEAHLEQHRHVMELIKSKVPAKLMVKEYDKDREYSLNEVVAENDGTIVARYTRYIGCGDYDTHDEYLRIEDLFKEQA